MKNLKIIILLVALTATYAASAQQPTPPAGGPPTGGPGMGSGRRGPMEDPDRIIEGGGIFPAGWNARVDLGRGGTEQRVNLVIFNTKGDGFHAKMGPAATFYNSSWTKSGNYTFSTRVTQTEKPTHPISYGIFVGGQNLSDTTQTYTYFLVRANREGVGEFYIATKKGKARPVAVVPWTADLAINKQDEAGKQVNVLGVQVKGNDVIFTSNGTEVARKTKAEVQTDGLIGFRVTHNTDIDFDQIKK